jgi:hypothetical protein
MRTRRRGRDRTGGRTRTTGSRALLGLALAGLLLAGCSAGSDGTSGSGGDVAQAAPDELSGGDRGGVVEAGAADGAGAGDAQVDAQVGAEAGSAAAGDAAQDARGLAAGTGVGSTSADAGGRQVITSGEVAMIAEDPRAAADAVVRRVEDAGGRVDERRETAARADESTAASADLTVRVPADAMTGLLAALDEIGEVARVDLGSDDVTAAAQDLDARISGMRLSVARMEDLLSRASTQEEILAAETTLTERQTSLEALVSERARIAEKVALSTLTVSIATPPEPAPPAEPEPAPEETGPRGFLDGLASGWSALVDVLEGVVTVLGVLLPWLALGGAIAWVVLAVRRSVRRRRDAAAGPGPGPGPGPDGPGDGPDDDPAEPDPAEPHDREPVGVG